MSDKNVATKKSERLFSLDVLRGLDMLFLCVGQPLILAVAKALGYGDATKYPFMRQFSHPWGGFTAYDLIMPLFIFMCGAAVPLALPKRLDAEGRPTAAFWKHVVSRMLLLWFLGMVCQGRLRSCDPAQFFWYTNTLQSIAVGYGVAALVMLVKNRIVQLAIPIVLAAGYGALLHLGGDYSAQGNIAMKVDMFFVNLIQPCGHDTKSYTWYLTSMMFGVMTLCGMEATRILLSARAPWRKAALLGAYGVTLWIAGIVLELLGVPCIKHIYTVSFTAQAMGVSVVLLAILYVITDIWRCRRGWGLVTLYGQTALASYVLGEIFRGIPLAASNTIFGGLAKRIGEPWTNTVIQLGLAVTLTYALHVWRTYRTARVH